MLMCVFTRTIWAAICVAPDSPAWIPSAQDSLVEWTIDKRGSNNVSTKDLRTIFARTWWELWKHRNAIIFEGARPSVLQLLQKICYEGLVWSFSELLKGNATPFFSRVEK